MPVITQVTNWDDTIDSRDIIAMLEEWENDDEPRDDDEEMELLRAFAEEAKGFDDWEHGLTLIRESYFADYIREYVEESGELSDVPSYIVSNIDWEGVSDDMRVDYSQVEYDGVTYMVR